MAEEAKGEEMRHKAEIYKILSMLYYQPTADLRYLLSHLRGVVQPLYPELVPYIQGMDEEFQDKIEDLTTLKVDHAKLFIGPFEVLAAPYGTVYLEGERRVMGDSTMEAVEHYKNAGLVMSKDFKEAPDHIAAELEFMYYLIFRYLETGDAEFLAKQQAFLAAHLGRWVDKFTDILEERAATDFYSNLAVITRNFVQRELQVLELQ